MFNIGEWTSSIPRKTFCRKHGRRFSIWSRDLVYPVTEVHTRPRQWKHHSRAYRSWSRLSCWPAIFEVYTHRDSPPCFYWLATCLYCGKKNRPGDTIRGKVKKIFRCSREYDRTWRESPNFSRCGRKEGKLARYPAPHFEAWKVDSAAQRLQGEAVFVLQPSVCILNFVVNNFWSAARYFN